MIESLPIIDPADEARRIVWEGFSEAYTDFRYWYDGDAPWPFNNDAEPPLVDMLVSEKVTFVSPEADEWLRWFDAQMAVIETELKYALAVGAVPQRYVLGMPNPA